MLAKTRLRWRRAVPSRRLAAARRVISPAQLIRIPRPKTVVHSPSRYEAFGQVRAPVCQDQHAQFLHNKSAQLHP